MKKHKCTCWHCANEGVELAGLANELVVQPDGWAMLSPYGDFPNTAWRKSLTGQIERIEGIQRVTKESAQEMVNEFNSWLGKAQRFVRGRRLYVGHPDVVPMANQYPDKTSKGVFTDLEAREDGFYGRLVLTDEGADLVEGKKYVALSPYWSANEMAQEDGKSIFSPAIFRSAGLTNRPNLPVRHLMNEQNNTMDKTKIIAWLVSQGVQIANEATDEQVFTALTTLGETIKGQKTALANEQSKVAVLEPKVTSLQADVTKVTGERDTAQQAFANERKARRDALIDQAVKDGRVLEADRAGWQQKLDGDFANESQALAKATQAIKTQSSIGDIGGRKVNLANEQDRQAALQAEINARVAKGMTYDAAWADVKRTCPALFEAMTSPK